MKKHEIAHELIGKSSFPLIKTQGSAFAPANIALIKYWGKRDEELNLPLHSSLSISLGELGTTTTIEVNLTPPDHVYLDEYPIEAGSSFYQRLSSYLDLFRSPETPAFTVKTKSSLPIKAGLASSASGYAALVLALNDLLNLSLDDRSLSILARLGSGSASRSIHSGFVQWKKGVDPRGMDSYGELLPNRWSDLRIALLLLDEREKEISSREAMRITRLTSRLYQGWCDSLNEDLRVMEEAILRKDIHQLGETAERNCLGMHATMLSSWPPILYSGEETIRAMRKIWNLRDGGLPLYFTQDAGPNLKLLFLAESTNDLLQAFPQARIVAPFKEMEERVILVDRADQPIGEEEKYVAHRDGRLHRAFSIFVFNEKRELLLQKRSSKKYHSQNLWSNSCCGHPRPLETTLQAAKRRLFEELAIDVMLQEVGVFHYTATLGAGLSENEIDHVFVGFFQERDIPFNEEEVAEIRWSSIAEVEEEIVRSPEQFTVWFVKAWNIAKRTIV